MHLKNNPKIKNSKMGLKNYSHTLEEKLLAKLGTKRKKYPALFSLKMLKTLSEIGQKITFKSILNLSLMVYMKA